MFKINCRKILSFFLSFIFLIPSFSLNYSIHVQAWTETDTPFYAMTIGGYTADNQMNSPIGVWVDNSGNIYVADGMNYRIQKFDSNGNFLMKFGTYGTEDGQFSALGGVCVDNFGNIYVTDNNRIQKFNSLGQFILKFGSPGSGDGQFNTLYGLSVDNANNIYVADRMNYRIQKFDPNGNFLMKLGSNGSGNSQFSSPFAVSVDSEGNIFVADRDNHRIQKFDSNGNFLTKVSTSYPQGLSVDNLGNIISVDIVNHRIQKYNSTGTFLFNFGTLGSEDGQLRFPMTSSVDSEGNIYVADRDNHRIQKFSPDGNLLLKIGGNGIGDGQFNNPRGVAIDKFENVYVTDTTNYRIQKFDSSGNFLMKFGSYGSGDEQFKYPYGIVIDVSENIFVVDTFNYRVQKFDSSGNFLMKFGINGSGDGQFSSPFGIALDGSDNIYVVESGNKRVQKFDSSGNFLMKFGSSGSGDGQFSNPYGIALDDSGNIYVVESGNNRVQKFNSEGNFLMKFGSGGSGDGQFSTPSGITVDTLGNIYVSEYGNNRIQKFDSDGNFLMKFGSRGIGNEQFYRPFGIVSKDNSLLIADTSNHRVMKYIFDQTSPTGTISVNNGGIATSSQEVGLNLSATDDLSGVYQMILSESSDFTGASWEDYATTKVFTLSSGDGEKTVYVKYVDNRTNYSEVTSDSIIYDTTGPTGTISINSGETITNTDEVTLTLSATDNLSGISKMMVSNKVDYSGGTWETYNTSKEWRLSMGDGEKRVYVKYRDEVGNISSSYSDSIEMDMGAPTGTLIINEGEEYTSSREVVLHITGEDEVTGVEEMRISEDRTMEGVDWEGYETSREYTLSEGDGYKVIYIQYRDGIGNESEVYGSNITLDRNTEIEVTEIGEEEVEGEIVNWETEETTPTFTGEGEVGATITIEIEGVETGTVIVNEDGVWSWTPSIELTRGQEYNVTITSTDLAGNEDIQTFTLEIADEEVIEVNQTTPETQETATQLPNTGTILIISLMLLGGLIWSGYNFRIIQKLKINHSIPPKLGFKIRKKK